MKKIFYFVRHGESIMNAKGLRQGPDGSLSENGVEQAHITGERLNKRPIETIIASPYERTKETAEIIAEHIKKPLEYSQLLFERRNPSEIIGKSIKDPEIEKIIDIIDKSYHSDDFRYSDEENFQDLKDRAKKLLDFLSARPEKCLLVVTHGIFLKMVVAYIVEGEKLTADLYNKLSYLNTSNNASITICEYNSGFFVSKSKKGWKLVVWDDYAVNK